MEDRKGTLVIDLDGQELTSDEKELLRHPLINGVILFSRNYEHPLQLQDLCGHIKDVKPDTIIMVDQEGGRVQRFKSGFTRLPPLSIFGKLYHESPEQAKIMAKECALLMAAELLERGVDLSLAPVLDINKKINDAIGDRAFHEQPYVVSELAAAYITGMREGGMACVGKHFPGHGHVSTDSHLATPIDTRELDVIIAEDMQPFLALIQTNVLSALMTAHIHYPKVDDQVVSYSRKWLSQVLRKQLGFKGLILSDDLNMGGAAQSNDFSQRFRLAKEAGVDIVLLCNNRQAVIHILDHVHYTEYMLSVHQWERLKGDYKQAQLHINQQHRLAKTREFLTKKQYF